MVNRLIQDYRMLFRIRNFEQTILDLFSQNKLTGTTHTCIGQEATPVALMHSLTEKDTVFGSHRCHGYFISYAKTCKPLLAEIMGKKSGMCKGRGGSQHICYGNFLTNGVQGGIVPNATGMAFAEKLKGSNSIVVAILGDGTLGQGVVYESMNMASIFNLPVLYLIEENGYAMTTPSAYSIAGGDICKRIEGFGIKVEEITSNDVSELEPFFANAIGYVRGTGSPACCIVHTYRMGPHSKGDDFRDPDELAQHVKNDPLLIMEKRLSPEVAQSIQEEEKNKLFQMIGELDLEGSEGVEVLLEDKSNKTRSETSVLMHRDGVRCVQAINEGLRMALDSDDRCLLFGEDIRDPYGGPFKATKGLSSDFSDRVLNTPISESAMVGLGVGMAMKGMRPVVEMMFGDFLSLGFDQLLNHAGKYHWMYAGQIDVPLLVRAPMGGKRGYGATHSQSLEKFMVGIPGIDVVALSPLHDPKMLIDSIFKHIDKPTILIEDKALYGQRLLPIVNDKMGDFYVEEENSVFPIISLTMDKNSIPDVAIVTYGGMTKDAMDAAEKLMYDNDLLAKIVVLTRLSPVDYEDLLEKVHNIPLIVTVEAGTLRGGWGAEIISSLGERTKNKRFLRVATPDFPIPCNKQLEEKMIPNAESIYKSIKKAL